MASETPKESNHTTSLPVTAGRVMVTMNTLLDNCIRRAIEKPIEPSQPKSVESNKENNTKLRLNNNDHTESEVHKAATVKDECVPPMAKMSCKRRASSDSVLAKSSLAQPISPVSRPATADGLTGTESLESNCGQSENGTSAPSGSPADLEICNGKPAATENSTVNKSETPNQKFDSPSDVAENDRDDSGNFKCKEETQSSPLPEKEVSRDANGGVETPEKESVGGTSGQEQLYLHTANQDSKPHAVAGGYDMTGSYTRYADIEADQGVEDRHIAPKMRFKQRLRAFQQKGKQTSKDDHVIEGPPPLIHRDHLIFGSSASPAQLDDPKHDSLKQKGMTDYPVVADKFPAKTSPSALPLALSTPKVKATKQIIHQTAPDYQRVRRPIPNRPDDAQNVDTRTGEIPQPGGAASPGRSPNSSPGGAASHSETLRPGRVSEKRSSTEKVSVSKGAGSLLSLRVSDIIDAVVRVSVNDQEDSTPEGSPRANTSTEHALVRNSNPTVTELSPVTRQHPHNDFVGSQIAPLDLSKPRKRKDNFVGEVAHGKRTHRFESPEFPASPWNVAQCAPQYGYYPGDAYRPLAAHPPPQMLLSGEPSMITPQATLPGYSGMFLPGGPPLRYLNEHYGEISHTQSKNTDIT